MKVKYGICNVHYAKEKKAEDGTITYDKPVPLPGAKNIKMDAEGDSNPFYADNKLFFNKFNNNGYSGELGIALLSDQFRKDILGEIADKNGALLEKIDAIPSNFALMFELDGDDDKMRFCFYHCSTSRPSTEANTQEDKTEPDIDNLSLTMTGRDKDNLVRAKLKRTDSPDAYDKFYESVYEPVYQEQEETPSV